jgi:PEP-CTERM motif
MIVNIGASLTDEISLEAAGLTALSGSGPHDSNTFYFVGVTSDVAFSSAVLTVGADAFTGFNIDTLRYGTGTAAVSEPAAIGLLGSGLVGLMALARRRRG